MPQSARNTATTKTRRAAEKRACGGVGVSSSMSAPPPSPFAACWGISKMPGATRPPASPMSAAARITMGNGTSNAKSATNAAAAMSHSKGWRSARWPMRHAAARTIATTAGFTP